ncbi:MAG: hypothetical protein ACRCXT_06850 [Paraclostridium sp.]
MKGFTKEQVLNSNKYRPHYDALTSLLKEDKIYSLKEVDSILNKFMKGAVK